MTEADKARFMVQALEESQKALPACQPNPPVGCVLVKDGVIVAKGYTQPPGQEHAEAMAIRLYGGSLKEVSVFVTLEPCSFEGQTPFVEGLGSGIGVSRDWGQAGIGVSSNIRTINHHHQTPDSLQLVPQSQRGHRRSRLFLSLNRLRTDMPGPSPRYKFGTDFNTPDTPQGFGNTSLCFRYISDTLLLVQTFILSYKCLISQYQLMPNIR